VVGVSLFLSRKWDVHEFAPCALLLRLSGVYYICMVKLQPASSGGVWRVALFSGADKNETLLLKVRARVFSRILWKYMQRHGALGFLRRANLLFHFARYSKTAAEKRITQVR